MTRFVALLRGVNVGGARKLPMGQLRDALSAAGFSGVRAYLQSGNVVFDAPESPVAIHTATIGAVVEREFGLHVDVLVMACTDLARAVAHNPFLAESPPADERWLHAAFLYNPISAETFAAVARLADDGERIARGDGVIYLLLPHGAGRSKLAGGLGRVAKTPMTARNWRTVTALVAMCRESATE